MKSKAILVSFIALFAIVFALSTVIASEVQICDLSVEVNDVEAYTTSPTIAGEVSNTVPVTVEFTACEDATDVKVKVYIEGYKNEISDETSRFLIVNGSRYVKRFSLTLPSTMDLDELEDELTEDLSLLVRISAKGKESAEESYAIKMQRELYGLSILSVDTSQEVTAGSTIPLDIDVENNGNERLDNVYVKVSIPDLGIDKKVFFGDIAPTDEEDYDDIIDSADKRIYVSIPRNAIPGTYNVNIEAYNYDASTLVQKKLVVNSAQTGIIPTATSKTIAIGEEATFDVVLVNPNDRMVVYSLTPEESSGLIIDISEPVVAIPADSSKTVQVKVKATDSAEEGTHLVTINVNSESGLVKQVSFSANVEKASTGVTKSNSVLILTVILAIIFVVLLIVLIVLLTKKPAEAEEFGETSYY
ncbi:MAG: hypothetical protein PHX96_02715 [Candidatus Nanoarchaeia archaeon]|nr:hypothetical protein [Candidatus Nanoarchaeia archaeon]